MKNVIFAGGLALIFAMAANTAQAAIPVEDILGDWKVTTDMGGRTVESTMTFSLEDGQLKGVASSDRGSREVENVKLEGDIISWTLNIQGNVIPIKVDVDGNTFKGQAQSPLGPLPITGTKVSEEELANKKKYEPVLGDWKVITDLGSRQAESTMTFSFEDGELKGVGKSDRGSLPLEDVTFDGETLAWKLNIQGNIIPVSVTVDGESFQGEVKSPLGNAAVTGDKISEAEKQEYAKKIQELVGDWEIFTEYNGETFDSKMRLFIDDRRQELDGEILMVGSEVEVRRFDIDGDNIEFLVAMPFVSSQPAHVKVTLNEDRSAFEGTVESTLGNIPITGKYVDTTKLVLSPYDDAGPILGTWDLTATIDGQQHPATLTLTDEKTNLKAVIETEQSTVETTEIDYKQIKDTMYVCRITATIPEVGERDQTYELMINGDTAMGEELYSQGQILLEGSKQTKQSANTE